MSTATPAAEPGTPLTLVGVSLATERLDLRALAPADAPALFQLWSNPDVARYSGAAPWSDPRTAVDAVARYARGAEEGRTLLLGIFGRREGRLLGTCSLFDVHAGSRRAAIGYLLDPSAWGHGYATEAVAALLAFGFDRLGLNRIEAGTDPRNVASRRVLERLGFVEEGLQRERWIVNGEKADTLLFGLLASEYSPGRW